MAGKAADPTSTSPNFAPTALLPERPTPGPRLIAGRYELGALIGTGASARVYRGLDQLDDLDVAVKLFPPGEITRRLREALILQSLAHPGLVTLYDFGADEGQSYLVMRLIDGPTLRSRLSLGTLCPAAVIRLAAALTEALAYVHDHGVTHLDLKPGNILLADDRPVITDFGIAHAEGAMPGDVMGTAAYMAPEQVLHESVGHPADVYALGLVLLECLTGAREYPGTAVESAAARVHRQPVVPSDLPHGLCPLLRKMTARKPEKRPSAAAVAGELSMGIAA